MAKTKIKIGFLFSVLFFLIGCTAPEPIVIRKTVEVKVPVYVPVEPPAYLLSAVVIPALPIFYKPTEKKVSSCLKPEDETKLKQTIYLLSARIKEWTVFGNGGKNAR